MGKARRTPDAYFAGSFKRPEEISSVAGDDAPEDDTIAVVFLDISEIGLAAKINASILTANSQQQAVPA